MAPVRTFNVPVAETLLVRKRAQTSNGVWLSSLVSKIFLLSVYITNLGAWDQLGEKKFCKVGEVYEMSTRRKRYFSFSINGFSNQLFAAFLMMHSFSAPYLSSMARDAPIHAGPSNLVEYALGVSFARTLKQTGPIPTFLLWV